MRAQWIAFAEAYIANGLKNATDAAIKANYSERSAHNQASRLMKNDEVQAYIESRLDELKLDSDEVMIRLAEQARAEYAQFFKLVKISSDGPAEAFEIVFDFEACQKAGKLHLIKKIKYDKDGRAEVEFYDAQSALVHIGRHYQLFTDKIDHTSGGEPLKLYDGWSPDEWEDDGDENDQEDADQESNL